MKYTVPACATDSATYVQDLQRVGRTWVVALGAQLTGQGLAEAQHLVDEVQLGLDEVFARGQQCKPVLPANRLPVQHEIYHKRLALRSIVEVSCSYS